EGGGEVRLSLPFSGVHTLLRTFKISANLFAVLGVVHWENVGLCHAQHFDAEDSRHLLFVFKRWIHELLEEGEVVERGVIGAGSSTGTNVRRRDAEMLQERCVVRTAAEISDGNVVGWDRSLPPG